MIGNRRLEFFNHQHTLLSLARLPWIVVSGPVVILLPDYQIKSYPPIREAEETMALSHHDALAVQPVNGFLTTVDAALNALALSNTVAEFLDLADKAEAFRRYAQRARLGLVAQNRCAELRLRAERKLGDLLATTPRLHGRPKSVAAADTLPSLADLGIGDRNLSHRAQRLAEIPATIFDTYLRDAQAKRGWEITTKHLLQYGERRQAAATNQQRIVGGRVADLVEFARAGNRMGTLYLDPPWPFEGTVLPYEPISLDDLRNLPVPALAAKRCHIHMWATGINFQFGAKEVIESWGFRIVGDFVWVKPSLGGRNYWRQSHETMMTAVWRDVDDRFDDHSLRSWLEHSRGRHSEKPEMVREMIERASPGPRLELFARKQTPGWFCWGHEIAEPLDMQTRKLDGCCSRSASPADRQP